MNRRYWVKERGTDWYCPLDIIRFDGMMLESRVVTGMNFMGDPEKAHKNALVVGEFWYEGDTSLSVEVNEKFIEDYHKEQKCTNE